MNCFNCYPSKPNPLDYNETKTSLGEELNYLIETANEVVNQYYKNCIIPNVSGHLKTELIKVSQGLEKAKLKLTDETTRKLLNSQALAVDQKLLVYSYSNLNLDEVGRLLGRIARYSDDNRKSIE